ncbi:hypothetical protein [Nitrosopumilus sp. S6]
MYILFNQFKIQEYLLFTLLGIAGLVLFANLLGQQIATEFTDWSSMVLSGSVMFFSIFMVSQYGIKGNHGKAWILFMLFSTYWFFGEFIGILSDLVLGIPVWEYADDFFFITGYQLFFAFLIFYLRPFRKQISKKLVLGAVFVSMMLIIPSMMMIVGSDSLDENIAVITAYPILDSIILIPVLIGVILFFKGEVNFMLSLVCLGIVSQIIGDNSMLFASLNGIYYPGHPGDILFLWTYVMFVFGLSNQIGLFSNDEINIACPACGKSCTGHD